MLCVLIKDVQDLDFISAAQLMKKQDLKLNPTLRRFVIEEHIVLIIMVKNIAVDGYDRIKRYFSH
jgi:hypothetical protein